MTSERKQKKIEDDSDSGRWQSTSARHLYDDRIRLYSHCSDFVVIDCYCLSFVRTMALLIERLLTVAGKRAALGHSEAFGLRTTPPCMTRRPRAAATATTATAGAQCPSKMRASEWEIRERNDARPMADGPTTSSYSMLPRRKPIPLRFISRDVRRHGKNNSTLHVA